MEQERLVRLSVEGGGFSPRRGGPGHAPLSAVRAAAALAVPPEPLLGLPALGADAV